MEGFFKSKGISPKATWLIATLPRGSGGPKEWEAAFQRILKEDLKTVVDGGALPANVGEQHKIELKGPFLLQVDDVLDISVSQYDQLCDIEKAEMERLKAEREGKRIQPALQKAPRESRVLKFTLHDGKTEVKAFERRVIKAVPNDPVLGSKLLVSNVEVRFGILHLRPENTHFLAGSIPTETKDLKTRLKERVDEERQKMKDAGIEVRRNLEARDISRSQHQPRTQGQWGASQSTTAPTMTTQRGEPARSRGRGRGAGGAGGRSTTATSNQPKQQRKQPAPKNSEPKAAKAKAPRAAAGSKKSSANQMALHMLPHSNHAANQAVSAEFHDSDFEDLDFDPDELEELEGNDFHQPLAAGIGNVAEGDEDLEDHGWDEMLEEEEIWDDGNWEGDQPGANLGSAQNPAHNHQPHYDDDSDFEEEEEQPLHLKRKASHDRVVIKRSRSFEEDH